MANSGVLVICGFGVVYRFVNWFVKAYGSAPLFGLLGCCRLREVWSALGVQINVDRKSLVSKAWSKGEQMIRC